MQTRKHPRTMQEAFGPYTSFDIADTPLFDWQDALVVVGCCVTVIAVAVILFIWG